MKAYFIWLGEVGLGSTHVIRIIERHEKETSYNQLELLRKTWIALLAQR